MNILKKVPFFLPLLVLFFCIDGYLEFLCTIDVIDIFFYGLILLLIIVVVYCACIFIMKNKAKASVLTFFIGVWYLFFGVFFDTINKFAINPFFKRIFFLVTVVLVATIAIGFILKHSKRNLTDLILYLNLLFLIFCIYDIWKIVVPKRIEQPVKKEIAFNYSLVKQKPDIYLIVLDEYPGKKSLQDSFNFSNTNFDEFLIAQNFKSLPIAANYNYTRYSMSSFLNMNYIFKDYDTLNPKFEDFIKRDIEIKNAAVYNIFEKMGYNIINNSIFDIENQRTTIESKLDLLKNKVFYDRFIRTLASYFYEKKLSFLPLIPNRFRFEYKNYNLNAIKSFENEIKNIHSKPVFSYTHLLMPHSPFYFDSLGNNTKISQLVSENLPEIKTLFLSQLKHTNSIAKEMVTKARIAKPNAIIIVMSDHGFRGYQNKEFTIKANFNNICWVNFPDSNYGNLNDSITNVNLFRYLFNTEYNQQMEYLKDSTISILLK